MELTLGYALIGAGFLLMVAELFIPSGGILGVLSLAGIGVGVALTFQYSTSVGLFTLIGVFIALPIFVSVLLPDWPRTPIGKRLVGSGPDPDDAPPHPAQKNLRAPRGR